MRPYGHTIYTHSGFSGLRAHATTGRGPWWCSLRHPARRLIGGGISRLTPARWAGAGGNPYPLTPRDGAFAARSRAWLYTGLWTTGPLVHGSMDNWTTGLCTTGLCTTGLWTMYHWSMYHWSMDYGLWTTGLWMARMAIMAKSFGWRPKNGRNVLNLCNFLTFSDILANLAKSAYFPLIGWSKRPELTRLHPQNHCFPVTKTDYFICTVGMAQIPVGPEKGLF